MRIVLFLLLLSGMYSSTFAQRVAIDGHFADWDSLSVLATDPAGDMGSSGADFTRLQADDDGEWLYLSFDTGIDMLIQEDNSLRLAIDTDANPSTGTSLQGIGAEFVWTFGDRSGTVRLGSTSMQIQHDDVRLIPAPSMTTSRFEVAIRRDVMFSGQRMFPSDSMRISLSDTGGDRLPDAAGGILYNFRTSGIEPGIELLIRTPEAGTVRLLSWNTLFNGLLDTQRQPAYTRLLRGLKPDIMCFQECFDIEAADVLSFIQSILQPPAGRIWRALKRDQGDILVTHLDVESSWQLQSEYRESAYLLRTAADEPLLLLNCHFRCCTANEHRQKEADGVIRFLRDAKSPGGSVTVPQGTPFVLVGDLNLVGDRRQYQTLITGDISNNAGYGADEAPDWDGGTWTDLEARHPSSLFNFTWDDNESSYAPGKLDYILYTASVLEVTQDLVVDPREISAGQRIRLGIEEGDARTASDHLPRFADLRWKNSTAVETVAADSWSIGTLYPQPARGQVIIDVRTNRPVDLNVSLHDILGRAIALPNDALRHGSAGAQRHAIQLPELHPGIYFLTISGGLKTGIRPMIVE